MATLQPGETIETREPALTIDAGLPPGTYRYRLRVVDAAGNESDPAEVTVVVVRPVVRPPLERVPRLPLEEAPTPTRPIPFPGTRIRFPGT